MMNDCAFIRRDYFLLIKYEMTSPVAVYDFRISAEGLESGRLKVVLRQLAKSWIFQLEKGKEKGYLHYQGRLSLIKKARKMEVKTLWENTFDDVDFPNYFEPTVGAPKTFDYNCYGAKADTRVEGPWSDKDPEPAYVPRQYRDKLDKLYPFQQVIFDSAKNYEDRMINMIYCESGNKGKSTIAALCELFGKGIDLPPVNDADKLIQACCDICIAKDVRDPSPIFVDLPRAMNKDRLYGIYTAVEQIKKGKLYDLRYTYKEWWIESPQVWVFSNIEPDLTLLSRDRWKVWTINENRELVKYVQEDDPLDFKKN